MGPVAPWHVGSSQTRARTRVPCIGRQILNHCTTREAQGLINLYVISAHPRGFWFGKCLWGCIRYSGLIECSCRKGGKEDPSWATPCVQHQENTAEKAPVKTCRWESCTVLGTGRNRSTFIQHDTALLSRVWESLAVKRGQWYLHRRLLWKLPGSAGWGITWHLKWLVLQHRFHGKQSSCGLWISYLWPQWQSLNQL